MSGRDDEQDCTAGCLAGAGIRSSVPVLRVGGGMSRVPGGLAWGVPVAGSLRCLADGSRVAVAMYRRFWWLQLGEQEFLRTLMLCATRGGGFDRHSGVTVIASHGSPSGKLVRVMAGGEAGALHSFAVAHEDGSKGRFWSGRPWSCDQDVQVCHGLGGRLRRREGGRQRCGCSCRKSAVAEGQARAPPGRDTGLDSETVMKKGDRPGSDGMMPVKFFSFVIISMRVTVYDK